MRIDRNHGLNQYRAMDSKRKPHREAVGTYLLQFGLWGCEGLNPAKRWRHGGASRWIGTPLAATAFFFWCVYIFPIIYALAFVCFYLESMFLWPKRWLKFNLSVGLVVLGVLALSQGFSGLFAAIFLFWLAHCAFKTIID